jgi:16S rRNA (guanine(966)-N(2))-methyltransferase RsmD
MRVIAGKARRLLLKTPEGFDTRPTTDKTKETLFNILNPYLADADFLDLFSGSGAIGIEALSRGAKYAAFVEKSKSALNVSV